MNEILHLQDCGDGKATVFHRSGCWKRRPGGPDSSVSWTDVSDDRPEARDSELWTLLEHGYQNQEATEPIRRFPRLPIRRFPRLRMRFPRLDPEVVAKEVRAKKDEIRVLWAENQKVQAANKQNRYELGKALDELHALRAHHGNGTYDRDVATLGIPKPTAWRVRNYYRDVAGLAPVPQFVSVETNLPDGTPASLSKDAGSAATSLRERAAKRKKITQVRLDPARHKIFHKKLKKLAEALETEGVSETTFKAIITYEVPACAK